MRARCIRITPAHAGKSVTLRAIAHNEWDHPRTCGEKKNFALHCCQKLGSPPHMRGKVGVCRLVDGICGITPAHAGKRAIRTAKWKANEDHPRTCGEKSTQTEAKKIARGSPPHMRGKVRVLPESIPPIGITPAHAGKRLKRSRSTVPHAAIVPLFPSVCNKPAGSDGSPAEHDAPPFLPIENAAPASPAYNLRSL